MISKNIKTEIIKFCQRMDKKGWVANHDGNISLRVSLGFAVTPTARFKGDLAEEDIIELDPQGKKTGGTGNLFSEWAIHSKFYEIRNDVQAVVHAHPPSATAVGCANQEMITWAIPEAVISLGSGVPLVGLGLPQSSEVMQELEGLIPFYDAVMIGGNGVFASGKTLEQAFLRLELVEHLANILIQSLALGGPKLLSHSEVLKLLQKRKEAQLALPDDPKRPQWFPGK